MADELPPLQQQPDAASIPDSVMQQLQHSSQWAGTFGGSDTNISQRARHNDDITAYADALNEQRAQAQAQLIQTNQTAQNLFIRTQQLQMQHDKAQADLALRNAQLQASNARTMATTHADLLKAKHDQVAADDTAGLSQHMSEIMDRSKPGEEDYNQGVLRGILAFPNAEKNLQANLLKNAGVQVSPEEFIKQGMEAKKTAEASGYLNPRIQEFHGKPVIVEGAQLKQPNPDARLSHLESLRMKPNVDPDVATYLDSEILKLKGQSPQASAATSAPASTPQAPESHDTPASFSAAFKSAAPGTVLHYQGKAYKKP